MGLLSKLNCTCKKKRRYKKKEPLVEREEEINNLNSRIADLEERIDLNKEDKKHARRENEKLKDQLKDQLEAQRQEIRNLEIQLQNEKKDLETERSYRQLTESEKESLSKQLKELEDTHNQVEEDTKKHRNKLEETQKLYEEEKKRYSLAVEERDRSLREEKKSSIAIADLRKHIERLEEEKETIRKVTESEKASLSEELQKSKKDLDNKRKQFEEDTKKHRNELEETMKLYDTEKKHFTSALEERDKYKQDRDTLEHTLDNTKKELENIKKEMTLTRSSANANKSSNAESELSDLKKECKGIKQEMENIMKSVEEWKSKLDTVEAELKKEHEKSTRNQIREKESPKEENEKLVKALQNVQATIAEERSKKAKDSETGSLSVQSQSTSKELEAAQKQTLDKITKLQKDIEQTKNMYEEDKEKWLKAEAEIKNKFKEYMHSQEEMLADTLNEHERAKQENNTQLNLARKSEDEWKSKLVTVEAELKKERGKSTRQTDLENRYKDNEHRLQNIIEDCRRKLAESEQAKEECLTRLSASAAAKILDNNPNITDLSDPNRPQKLAEFYSQMYDDQWTDATEALEKIVKNDEEGIKILLNLLIETYKYCKDMGETQLNHIHEVIFLPPLSNTSSNLPDDTDTNQLNSPGCSKQGMSKVESEKKTEIPVEIQKGIKEYRKKVAMQVLPRIENDVLTKFKKSNQFGDDVLDACKIYIRKCIELCWLMRVQDPPVALSWSVPDGRVFPDEFYRAYTRKGKLVEYVVWPSMHLYENGPMLVKGVAQGAKP